MVGGCSSFCIALPSPLYPSVASKQSCLVVTAVTYVPDRKFYLFPCHHQQYLVTLVLEILCFGLGDCLHNFVANFYSHKIIYFYIGERLSKKMLFMVGSPAVLNDDGVEL